MSKSKYTPLFDYLSDHRESTVVLSLVEIESIVGKLPSEAQTPQFWANTPHHLSRRGAWLNANYRAFFDRSGAAVRFERAAKERDTGTGWSDLELEACVAAYRQLWIAQQQARTLNKSALRRDTRQAHLKSRSDTAYEKRMQNISAVLDELGIDWVIGYAPLRNIGAPRIRLEKLIKLHWKILPTLSLVTDKKIVRSAFNRWQTAILDFAAFEGSVGWIPHEEIAVCSYGDAPDGKLDNKAAFRVDPVGRDWVLQINVPSDPTTENGLSAVAEDSDGKLYLLRQGVLHQNNMSPRISGRDFQSLSGLSAVDVRLRENVADRLWFLVSPIDTDKRAICRHTARFVKICARLRHPDRVEKSQAEQDAVELAERFGQDEKGGSSSVVIKGGTRIMRRRHGEVWQALKTELLKGGKTLKKPLHARGYETDGEVTGKGCKILLEIKTTKLATDVYTGVGQLQIYPQLLQRLSTHRRILLLPERPVSVLSDAVAELDIELHVYQVVDPDDWTTAVFPHEFLKLCGLT